MTVPTVWLGILASLVVLQTVLAFGYGYSRGHMRGLREQEAMLQRMLDGKYDR